MQSTPMGREGLKEPPSQKLKSRCKGKIKLPSQAWEGLGEGHFLARTKCMGRSYKFGLFSGVPVVLLQHEYCPRLCFWHNPDHIPAVTPARTRV